MFFISLPENQTHDSAFARNTSFQLIYVTVTQICQDPKQTHVMLFACLIKRHDFQHGPRAPYLMCVPFCERAELSKISLLHKFSFIFYANKQQMLFSAVLVCAVGLIASSIKHGERN